MDFKEWLKEDRQWTRAMRVAHAKFRLANAGSDAEKLFWQAVLEANGERTKKS
jgi:hypothetical protein